MSDRRRFRLLPPGTGMGWTPYAWLAYLPAFLMEPIARSEAGQAGVLYWTATIVALVLFLITYFRGFWLSGRRLLPIITFQTALGIGFAPINVGSCVLFVYAGSFAGQLDRARRALGLIVAIAVLGGASALLSDAPVFYWITASGVTLLVGAVNLHFAQGNRAQRRLRLAQDEVEQLAKVAERERIARDLHDVLGHTLSLIVLKAELAGKLVGCDPARATAEMRDVEEVARRTLQEVRETIRGYHATLDDELDRARSMLKAAGIGADFDTPPVSLPPPIDETLAFALREAITNVVRHSGASQCHITLSGDDAMVTLDIADDGRGSRKPEGAGLRGMRERVEALGGTIERHAARGMRLRIAMPAKPAGTHAARVDGLGLTGAPGSGHAASGRLRSDAESRPHRAG